MSVDTEFKTRDRLYYMKRKSVYYENLYNGRQVTTRNTDHEFTGGQQTWSRTNPLWLYQERSRQGSIGSRRSSAHRYLMDQDAGSNFQTIHYEYADNAPSVSLSSGSVGEFTQFRSFTGSLFPFHERGHWSQSQWPKPAISETELLAMGTTAISRTIPTNPAAGAAQFIGELKERLPSLPGRELIRGRGPIPARGSKEYLNYEFGLKPIVDDVQKFARAVTGSEKFLSQLERDSGRLVRRRYRFPDQITNEVITSAGGRFAVPNTHLAFYPAGGGSYVLRRKTENYTWFSGAYTYFFKRGDDSLAGRMRQAEQYANNLLGLRISPELLWELAPWSWAADWIANIGDVMTNVTAFSNDSLVLRWGYVMRKQIITDTHTLDVNIGGVQRHLTQVFKTTVKKRVRATPYGFGLDPGWSDLSPRQLAILAALGITRAS